MIVVDCLLSIVFWLNIDFVYFEGLPILEVFFLSAYYFNSQPMVYTHYLSIGTICLALEIPFSV